MPAPDEPALDAPTTRRWPMSQLSRVFAADGEKLNVQGGVAVAAVLFLLWFVIEQTNQQKYFISIVFAVLLVAQSDPGGSMGRRMEGMSLFALLGALVTALGFYVGDKAWGFVVLAVFALTLLGGLAVKLGVHRFAAGVLLNVWFLVVLSLATHDTGHLKISPWDQALAWLIGAAAWIGFMLLVWLASRGRWQPAPVMDVPGSQSPVQLTRPVVLFALIRALALAASTAIAFGGGFASADWMPIATIVAMKPSLEQSKLFGEQRVVGAALGAAAAIPILILVGSKHALEAIVILLAGLGIAIRGVNYAYYAAAIACAALIAADLPQPTNYAAEGRRVLFTLTGVGIGVAVMFVADRLQKHSAQPA